MFKRTPLCAPRQRQKSILIDDLSECFLPFCSAQWTEAQNQLTLCNLHNCSRLGSPGRRLQKDWSKRCLLVSTPGISTGLGYGGMKLGLKRDQAVVQSPMTTSVDLKKSLRIKISHKKCGSWNTIENPRPLSGCLCLWM